MYYLITLIRNFLFDKHIIKGRKYTDVFVLTVGNLRVGGTGKTPMVEYLIRHLREEFNLAVVSLGYGRKTKGLREIKGEDTAQTVGDEPLQMYQKFKDIRFFVCKNRNTAIDYIRENYKDIQLIVLDDAMQYRKTLATKTILLTEYSRPFYKDHILPYGRLREMKQSSKRADYIIVTKCPEEIEESKKNEIISNIKPTNNQKIFFSRIIYSISSYNIENPCQIKNKKLLFVAAIDNPAPAIQYLQSLGNEVDLMKYQDHHKYNDKDIARIKKAMKTNQELITTQKDAVKLRQKGLSFYVLEIENQIDNNFLNILKDEIRANLGS